jgi:DNA-binding GntR family transcriptional regulator
MLLRDNVYDALRADILSCRLLPGEEIREQVLAQRYEVSRQPVRDALLRLERERLVTVHPRQGYQVNPISVSDARDIFQFRLVLEPACVAEAAENASEETLSALDAFRVFDGNTEFIQYNRAFHCAIAQASGNSRMSAAACDLIEQADRLVRVSLSAIKGRDPAQLVAEHVDIIDAIQRRDARKAKRIIRDHVARAERRVLSALARSAVIV